MFFVHSDMAAKRIPNWIGGEERAARSGEWFDKLNPANGELIYQAARSSALDIDDSVTSAKAAQPRWAETPAVTR